MALWKLLGEYIYTKKIAVIVSIVVGLISIGNTFVLVSHNKKIGNIERKIFHLEENDRNIVIKEANKLLSECNNNTGYAILKFHLDESKIYANFMEVYTKEHNIIVSTKDKNSVYNSEHIVDVCTMEELNQKEDLSVFRLSEETPKLWSDCKFIYNVRMSLWYNTNKNLMVEERLFAKHFFGSVVKNKEQNIIYLVVYAFSSVKSDNSNVFCGMGEEYTKNSLQNIARLLKQKNIEYIV